MTERTTIPELLKRVAEDVKVADVQYVKTDMGTICTIELWAMQEKGVLRMFVQTVPEELVNFDLDVDGDLPMRKLRQHLDEQFDQ